MKPPRVLLADAHPIVIEGLHRVLEPDFEIAGSVADGIALVAAADSVRPDIIITDISIPLLNGIEAVRQIRKAKRKVAILFFTMHPDVTYVIEALRAGGSAYVLKTSAGVEIRKAIREALGGRIYLAPSINRAAVQAQQERAGPAARSQSELTTRQREVLQAIAEGRTTKEIAETLHVSLRTVEFHKYRIRKALALRTTAELVQYAIKHGIAS
jgi:DNA-binding NarL/FixJ family response regulator